jgi:hypothetical protein
MSIIGLNCPEIVYIIRRCNRNYNFKKEESVFIRFLYSISNLITSIELKYVSGEIQARDGHYLAVNSRNFVYICSAQYYCCIIN